MFIKINDQVIAIGGDWALPSSKEEASTFLLDHQKDLIIEQKQGNERAIGAYSKPPKKNRSESLSKIYSGALLVGLVHPDAILYHQIEEDQIWVLAIREGIPLPNHDVVCLETDAQQILSDMLSFNPSAVVVGTVVGASVSLSDVLATLSKKQWASVQIINNNQRKYIILVVSVVIGLIVFGFGQYFYRQMESNRELALRLKLTQSQVLKETLASEEKKKKISDWRANFERSMEDQRNKIQNGITAEAAQSYIFKLTQSLPMMAHGWELSSIDCNFVTLQCALIRTSWQGHGTADSAKQVVAEDIPLPDLIKGVFTVVIKIPMVPEALGFATNETVLHVASMGRNSSGSVITLQLGLKEIKALLPPSIEEVPLPEAPIIGSSMTWSGNLSYHLFEMMGKRLVLPGVRVERLMLNALNTPLPTVLINGSLLMVSK